MESDERVESDDRDDTPFQVNPEEVARRAHERFGERGGQHGDDQADWFQAERDIRERAGRPDPAARGTEPGSREESQE